MPCVPSATYSTAHIYINCTDEFHTLWCRVVRRVYMIFCAHGWKKCAIHVPLLFSAISFICISCIVTYFSQGWKCTVLSSSLSGEKKFKKKRSFSEDISFILQAHSISLLFSSLIHLVHLAHTLGQWYHLRPTERITNQLTHIQTHSNWRNNSFFIHLFILDHE